MWPSAVPNPNQRDVNFPRDYMGELTAAVEKSGMRMGIYYSGGFDWTFNRGPIETNPDYDAVKPETVAYGAYADAQIRELIDRYHPAVLWNDIDWPRSGDALADMAYYYNAVPDGVVDDRYGVPHADFNTKEYTRFDEIQPKKWEANRGLGQSFGYNRAEGEANTIAPAELIALLADVVSKNGNLLLGIGPEADGSIAPVQMERLVALGAWMKQNGEAIYGTRPWTRASGETADGQQVRFTQKAGALYAILLGAPKSATVVIRNLKAPAGSDVSLLGEAKPLAWKQQGADLEVELPATLPGKYAYVLRLSQ
jgi:alpha-L-fucosidase